MINMKINMIWPNTRAHHFGSLDWIGTNLDGCAAALYRLRAQCAARGSRAGSISPIFRWHQKSSPGPASNGNRSLMIGFGSRKTDDMFLFVFAQFWFVRLPLFFLFFFFCQSSLWLHFWRTMVEHSEPLHTSPTR